MKTLFARLGLAAALLALFAIGLLVASELQEVVVLTSTGADGRSYETRLWVVDDAGTVWLRAGDVRRGWYQRVRQSPNVELLRNGTRRPYRATLVAGEEARRRVDRLMRAKYGWTDALISLLEGSPVGVPVRLDGR